MNPDIALNDIYETNPVGIIEFDNPVGFITLVVDVTATTDLTPLVSPNDN